MRKNGFKRTLAIAVCAAMVAGIAGCGQKADEGVGNAANAGSTEGTGSTAAGKDTTADTKENKDGTKDKSSGKEELPGVTFYPKDANLQSGVVGGYKADIFADHGFELEVWAYSDEKTNAILASGALPDVMCVSRDNQAIMIESGMILNLEDRLDQMPHIRDNEGLTQALNYMRTYSSAGTGQLYGIPTVVGGKVMEYGVTKNMLVVNWEYYKGIGAPEFKDQWELIDVMKQMLDAYPTGKDGIPNYGTYLNAGSDTQYWANITQYLKWFGYEPTNLYYLLETDMVNAEYHSILNADSKYQDGLKWYNTLYRDGLLDPDSINNDRATQKAKVDNGYAMVPSGTLQGYSNYQPIFMTDQKLYQESWNSIYGNDAVLVVSAKSQNVDAALSFIDMLADPDAYLYIKSGPEGDLWDTEDGTAYVKDEVIEKYKNNQGNEIYLSDGEKMELWSCPFVIDDTSHPSSYLAPDGTKRGVRLDRWSEIQEITYNTDQMNEWREISGYEFFVDQAMDQNAYSLTSALDYVTNFTPVPDDMMKLTLDSIKDVVVNASWQMVYAESDEAFSSIWEQMVKDCNDLGAQEVIDWRLNELNKAVEVRDSLAG